MVYLLGSEDPLEWKTIHIQSLLNICSRASISHIPVDIPIPAAHLRSIHESLKEDWIAGPSHLTFYAMTLDLWEGR